MTTAPPVPAAPEGQQASLATATPPTTSAGIDKYQVTNDYERHWAHEKALGGYNVDAVESFSSKEDAALPTPLDGNALTKEIGGATLTGELNDRDNGAGIKDKADLADLLASIKGANVFLNKTPKEQL
eukprot:CAMPEP_0170479394 /NCGR_PEP_ID=MMETSP0208-20121228/653_1 /TAXON_ID=197538 /ORGANISM="Strombidium inclinatum, Strain S3" /LENGTH=127 /DNA_ID=CAMNT_0010751783 /DNA_START=78 /DNA_END=461 /DNA_ORIENTATION=+